MRGIEGISRTYTMGNDDIITVSVILLFVLFTFVLFRSRIVLAYKFSTFFSSRQIYAQNELSTSNEEFLDILLLIFIGCLSLSTILYSEVLQANGGVSHYGFLLTIFLCIALLVVGKSLLYSLVNWTFFSADKGRNWMSSFFFSIAIVSVIFFPLALIRIFIGGEMIDVTFCILCIIILQKILLIFKLFVNFRPKNYGGVLFFLYFCSVEIMPTLIVLRILKDINGIIEA